LPKVKRRFRDIHDYKFYNKGDSYSHEDEDRIAYLIEQGFLEGKKPRGTKKESPSKEKSDK